MEPDLIVLGLAGLLVLVCLLTPFSSLLKIPFTLSLSIAGAILGYIIHIHDWAPEWFAEFLVALRAFEMSSDTILIVFLPILLFEASLAMNVRRLLKDIGPVMVMAVVAVFVSTLFIGFGVSMVTTETLAACLLLGAIVATTDPAAVVGIFKEVGAPKRLTLIVEGESLLNDAAAISLYTVLVAIAARGTEIHWNLGPLMTSFSIQLVGGAILGYLIGRLTCMGFALLRGRPTAEISLSLATAYISYIVGEHYAGVSGVVSTVAAGLTISAIGRSRVSPHTFQLLGQAWNQLGFWASSLVFILAAMMIPNVMTNLTWQDGLIVLVMMVTALAARSLTVFGVMPLTAMAGSAKISTAYKTVISWGGLRGAISLTLALSVTEHPALSEEIRRFVAVSATGFVLSTLLINGLTLSLVIRLLGLNKLTATQEALREQASIVITNNLKHEIDDLAQAEHISDESRAVVEKVFQQRISSTRQHAESGLAETEELRVGLSILARREFELLFNSPHDYGVDSKTVDRLLAFAQNVEEMVASEGPEGYEELIERSLDYSLTLRLALRLDQYRTVPRWLGYKLGQRFVYLLVKRLVTRRLIVFNQNELRMLVDDRTTNRITELLDQRLNLVEENIKAMRLQFPNYAKWLEQSYLGRAAQNLEIGHYRSLLSHSLISAEVYEDLTEEARHTWEYFDKIPPVDPEWTVAKILGNLPVFSKLDAQGMQALTSCFTALQVEPNDWVIRPGSRLAPLYLIASGAVAVTLTDNSEIDLGSGDTFGGELLLDRQMPIDRAYSLGYSRLYVLDEEAYDTLLQSHSTIAATIKTAIENVTTLAQGDDAHPSEEV